MLAFNLSFTNNWIKKMVRHRHSTPQVKHRVGEGTRDAQKQSATNRCNLLSDSRASNKH